MNDQRKTKAQLIEELEQTRKRLAEFERTEDSRKRAEEMLRESEDKYRTIFENISDQLIYFNKYGTIVSANDQEGTYGRTPEEIIGKHFTKLSYFNGKDIPKYLKLFKEVITGQETVNRMELEINHKDGHKIPIEVSTKLVKKNGKIEGLLCIARDITERRRAEEALRESEEKYRTIFEGVSDHIVFLDDKGTIISANDHEKTFGRKPEELIGKKYTELDSFDAKDVPRINKLYEDIITGKKTINRMELEIKKKDGNKIPVEVSTTLVKKDGEIEGFLCMVRDITERKRAEVEIQRRTEDLALINDMNNAIDHGKSLDEIIHLLSRKTKGVFSAYGAAVYLINEDKRFLTMVQIPLDQKTMQRIKEVSGIEIPSLRIPLNADGLHREVIQEKKMLLINDQKKILRWMTELANFSNPTGKPYPTAIQLLIPQIGKLLGITSTMAVPLISEDEIIGLLEISGQKPFVESDLLRLEILSGQMSTVIKRKQAEEELKNSEERYRTVVEDMPALICRFLPDGILSFVNNAYCQYFGKKYEELVGHNFFQFIPAEDREKVREHYSSISKEKPVKTYEHQVIAADGTVRWQRWTDRGLFDESDTLVEYQSIGEDVTERKRVEEALKESEKMLEKQNELLNDKNAALREMIRQIDDEKNQMENQILANVDQIIMPILARLRGIDAPVDRQYIDLLEESLKNIISGFGYKLYKRSSALSPREIEIGNMIRNGLSSKEIARLLNLSVMTINAHRNNIRKKLRIRNEKVNLNTYLQSL